MVEPIPRPKVTKSAADAAAEARAPFAEFVDRGLAQTKEAHEKASAVMQDSADALNKVFAAANQGAAECRSKLIEIARTNANAAFDMASEAMTVKSLTELMELSAAHSRRQLETAMGQFKEFSELTQKVVTDATEPLKTGIAERFRLAS